MGPDVLQTVHISHDGLCQVCKIALPEVAKGQLS